MKTVTLKIRSFLMDGWQFRESLDVFIDNEHIASEMYGGEPEDNLRCRDYKWVERVIKEVAEKLDATVIIEEKSDF